jgi:hypothetical protein
VNHFSTVGVGKATLWFKLGYEDFPAGHGNRRGTALFGNP